MKKRSLVAALAMLIVSAIVLTSATYAWFATNNKAELSVFSSSVGNAAGSLYISTTGNENTWKSALGKGDFTAASASATGIADTLNPVSYDPAKTGGVAFAGAGFNTQNSPRLSVSKNASTADYTAIRIWMYAETTGTVTITPTIGAASTVPYVYATVITEDGDSVIVGSTASDSYDPIYVTGSNTSGYADDNQTVNSIIDSNEIGADKSSNVALADTVTAAASASAGKVTVDIDTAGTAGKTYVDIHLWAEGQDDNCVGGATASPTFTVDFDFAGTSTN